MANVKNKALKICDRCGKINPAEIHTCTPKEAIEQRDLYSEIKEGFEALEQEEVSDAELISYRQGYEQGRFDYEMDLELGKIKQPAQEPVAEYIWVNPSTQEQYLMTKITDTHPAPSWQGLSDDEIVRTANGHLDCVDEEYIKSFARAIEQALKDKNYGN